MVGPAVASTGFGIVAAEASVVVFEAAGRGRRAGGRR